MSIDLRPASELSRAELTALFNDAYEGYVVPFRLDEALLAFMVDTYDIDLDASRVAYRDGKPVGLANLAVRGDEAWVGGVGVVPAARREGIGERLMDALHDAARERGVARVWLEVIEQNDAAFRLYEKLGYVVERWVEVWTLSAELPPGSAREAPAERAHTRVRELRTAREPWQRADGTVANLADARGLETDGGAAVFRLSNAAQVVQLAGADLPELLRTLRGHGTVSMLNVPADDPAAEAFRELGGSIAVRQREMVLTL